MVMLVSIVEVNTGFDKVGPYGKKKLHLSDVSLTDRIDAVPKFCDIAREHATKLTDEPKLQILCIPEFFFALHSAEGASDGYVSKAAIPMNDFLSIQKTMKEISQAYPKILLIPGTCFWKIPYEDSAEKLKAVLAERKFGMLKNPGKIYNYEKSKESGNTPTQEREKHRKWLVKELEEKGPESGAEKCNVDFIRNEATLYYRGERIVSYQKITPDESEYSFSRAAFVSGSLNPYCHQRFELNSLTIGIEICADHANAVLRTRYPDQDIDIQIIVSAYIDGAPYPEAMAVKDSGCVIHADSKHGGNVFRPPGEYLEPDIVDEGAKWYKSVKSFIVKER